MSLILSDSQNYLFNEYVDTNAIKPVFTLRVDNNPCQFSYSNECTKRCDRRLKKLLGPNDKRTCFSTLNNRSVSNNVSSMIKYTTNINAILHYIVCLSVSYCLLKPSSAQLELK